MKQSLYIIICLLLFVQCTSKSSKQITKKDIQAIWIAQDTTAFAKIIDCCDNDSCFIEDKFDIKQDTDVHRYKCEIRNNRMILTDKVGKQLIYEIRDVNIYEREVGSDKFFKSNLILYDPKLQKEYHYIIDPE